MYEYITGRLEEVSPTDAIVEAAGVGYDLLISLSTFSKIQGMQGQTVKLYTSHLVREDDETLYGFADRGERSVFLHLISVSGVGPGSARMILSAMTADEVRQAVLTGDVNRFKSVKGIGSRKYFWPLTSAVEAYKGCPWADPSATPVAARMAAQVLTLPLSADLEPEQVERICALVRQVLATSA